MSEKTSEELGLDYIMRSADGRAFLLRLLNETGYFESAFNVDPVTMALFNGKREIGLWLVGRMTQANPGQLVNILKENFNV